jgi:hypothetical protein
MKSFTRGSQPFVAGGKERTVLEVTGALSDFFFVSITDFPMHCIYLKVFREGKIEKKDMYRFLTL